MPAVLFSLSTNPIAFDAGLTFGQKRGLTSGLPTIDPNAGTTTQALGRLAAEDWLHGSIPWWNPYSGIGLPLAAEMQGSSLFLPFVLLLAFGKGVLYLRLVLQVAAGLATFALSRRLRVGTFAAFLGSLLYAFNGTFAWFQHASIMPLPFLPWLLLGVEQAMDCARQRRPAQRLPRGWALISVAIAASLYAGFPETAYVDGLLAVVWMCVRLFALPAGCRVRFLTKNAIGCALGLLLAAPALLPFFEYLRHSVAIHAAFGSRVLPVSSFLQLLMPYAFGPIEGFAGIDPTSELTVNWGNIGGYFGAAALFLSVLSLWSGRRERALRFSLALWTTLVVLRMVGFPGSTALFQVIPGMDLVAIYRYGLPSCEMAVAVLVALALEEWRAGRIALTAHVLPALGSSLGVLALGLWLSKPLLLRLWLGSPNYPNWIVSSAVVALAILAICAVICLRRPSTGARAALATVIAFESLTLYTLPSLAGLAHPQIDLGPVEFLRRHLGLQRYYALGGGLTQNYSAYFQLASVNYGMLPVDSSWAQYVVQTMDPGIPAELMSGDYPPPQTERNLALLDHLSTFQEAGVKYIVSAPYNDPLSDKVALPHAPNGNIPTDLRLNQSISGLLPPTPKSGSVEAVGVVISTYEGKALGDIAIELCSAQRCAAGHAPLLHAIDNRSLRIPLDQSLTFRAREQLRFNLRHLGGSYPLAIWIYPTVNNAFSTLLPDGRSLPMQPDFVLHCDRPGLHPALVYQSPTAIIFELPQPSPYFETLNGSCNFKPQSHEIVKVTCTTPAQLLRRELFYPGWRATINGHSANVVRSRSVFQMVDLPAGDSLVKFSYAPTNIGWGYAAFLIGSLGLLTQIKRSRPSAPPDPEFVEPEPSPAHVKPDAKPAFRRPG